MKSLLLSNPDYFAQFLEWIENNPGVGSTVWGVTGAAGKGESPCPDNDISGVGGRHN